jgi:hypothetical protein
VCVGVCVCVCKMEGKLGIRNGAGCSIDTGSKSRLMCHKALTIRGLLLRTFGYGQ